MTKSTSTVSIDQLANLARNGGMAKKMKSVDELPRAVVRAHRELSPLTIKVSRIINSLKI